MNKTYKIGIVEDEIVERKALQLMITRNRPVLEIVFEAGDGKSALQLVRRHSPDILIVDIKIPELSGLELCRVLRDEGYAGHIIISTSYSLFNYAYQAIKLNVMDYLLKPTDEEQILGVLDRCISLLEQDETTKEKEQEMVDRMSRARRDADLLFIDQILAGDARLLPRLYDIGFPEDGQWQAVWISLSIDEGARQLKEAGVTLHASLCAALQKEFFIFSRIESRNALVFIQPKDQYEVFHLYAILRCCIWSLRQITRQCTPCYVSQICSSLEEVKAAGAYLPEDLSILQLTSKDYIAYISFDKMPRALTRDKYIFHMHRIVRLLQDKRIRYLEKMVLAEIKASAEQALRDKMWEYIRIFIDALTTFSYNCDLSPLRQNIADPNMLTDFVLLKAIVHQLLSFGQEMQESKTEASMERILQIMRTEYASNLSQAEVAQRVGLTQTYFSRMFKQKTGKNFVSVLTDIRIERAKELIAENNRITLEELTVMCGYTSKTYFCSFFRKATGMTVSEYQKRRNDEK